jgi:hypothetical protein
VIDEAKLFYVQGVVTRWIDHLLLCIDIFMPPQCYKLPLQENSQK